MKYTIYFLLGFFFIAACKTTETAISQDMDIPDLVTVTTPADTNYTLGSVFVDSVEKFTHERNQYLLIKGNFPNPCCSLYSVDEKKEPGKISLTLTSWQRADEMCIQVLQPFAFFHPASHEGLRSVVINNTIYALD